MTFEKKSELFQEAQSLKNTRLTDLFDKDANRVNQFSLEVDQIHFDYSKNFITTTVLQHLINLANESGLASEIENLFSGKNVNCTENRPALHPALRQMSSSVLFVNNKNIIPEIMAEKQKMYALVEKIQQRYYLGQNNEPITTVVNIGIGGSDLGPLMAVEALKAYQQPSIAIHFISNVDPEPLHRLLNSLEPAKTLFIISSKSFSTPETLTNAMVAKRWLQSALGDEVNSHWIAVTANPERAKNFGVSPENILCFAEGVGGRYSVWSTIGFPLALSIGVEHFESFLAGARLMDDHFRHSPFDSNMPVLLALIGIWYINFWQASTLAVLPYTEGLRRFPDYLQQLDMESNGKSTHRNGSPVDYATGPIIWGQVGTNGQHAFFQHLHQGTHFVPMDFILPIACHTGSTEQQRQLLANGLAQAQALMMGDVKHSNTAHQIMLGNKPSNILLLKKLSPKALGELLALYEHKVFVQGVIWGINSFDQPGVELGKTLASALVKNLEGEEIQRGTDPSTIALIQKIRSSN